MKIRAGVFFGGKSVEHEVSVISAIQAINNLNKDKYEAVPIYITRDMEFYTGELVGKIEQYRDVPALLKKSVRVSPVKNGSRTYLIEWGNRGPKKKVYDYIDVALPVVHGTNVEDGALQGFLRTIGVPFAGCDVCASAVGMDKYIQKLLFREAGIPVLPCLRFYVNENRGMICDKAQEVIGLPAVVKPANLGSSVGIKIARTPSDLKEAIEYAFDFTPAILIEKAVGNLREINCAVIGDYEEARASECEEPVMADEILSYEDKYVSGGKGMSGLKRLLPAPIPGELRERVRDYAVKAFKALDCSGVARIDFLMDGRTGEVWINEINTIPGSLSYYLWEPTGLKYTQMLDELVSLALKRERERANLSTAIETGILANFSGGSKGKL
jgi:D-alanine-D-alanine ligase